MLHAASAELLRRVERWALNPPSCTGCNCTWTTPCIDGAGQPCRWMEGYDGYLCSECGRVAIAVNAIIGSAG